jgi:ABC-type nitrate/sulfonate/bicarbonate transport system substrate-binding protein
MKTVAFLFALLMLPVAGFAQTPPPASAAAQKPDTLKLLINPQLIFGLPLLVAIERGFFAQQNLDVKPIVHVGSSQTIIPSLARGDVDIATISANPGFFNQFSQGFDAKLIASQVSGHKGWDPAVWLVVRQDVWDAKQIRAPHDLRGKKIDVATPGSEGWYLARHLLTQAALTPADMTFSQRFSTAPDWILSLRNVNEVQAAYEPTVTQLEQQKIGHRWLSITDVDPGYQESFLAASAATLKSHPDAIRRFLIGYLKACKVIVDSKGKWTPELVRIWNKWSSLPVDMIAAIPTPPYTGAYGQINVPDLEQVQRFWHTYGLVNSEQSIDTLIDTSFITAAQKATGLVPQK